MQMWVRVWKQKQWKYLKVNITEKKQRLEWFNKKGSIMLETKIWFYFLFVVWSIESLFSFSSIKKKLASEWGVAILKTE